MALTLISTASAVAPVSQIADNATAAKAANCPAAAGTVVKATPGALLGVWITGTGTAGTVTVADTGTTWIVAGVPAAVGTWALPVPSQGIAFNTSLTITTAGTGVTACALYI